MPKIFNQEGHAEKILQKLWKQCETTEFCDVELIAGSEEKRISAHRNVLSAASDYFARMFVSPMRESVSGEVEMPSVNGGVLRNLVEFCYTGSVAIREEIAVELLETAHLLLFSTVVGACENFLVEQLHPSNCLGFAHLAHRYDCEMLLEEAKDYISDNFVEIYGTDEFLDLNLEQLSGLLGCDELCVSEEEVFHSLKAWIQHDPTERAKHKVQLLEFVRMPLLQPSFLVEHVKPFCDSTNCHKLYVEATQLQLLSNGGLLDASETIKPRRRAESLMALTPDDTDKKMFLHYFCSRRHKWMKWSNSLEYRQYFATAIMEDDLFVVGGVDAKPSIMNTVICLNIKTMTLKPVASMQNKCTVGCAVVLNGFLYAVGGWNGSIPTNTVEKWNPKTNEWNLVASMSVNRCHFGAAVLNGKLYAVGGYVSKDDALSSAECYNPIQNVWESIASMGEGRQQHGVAVVNGFLYAVGGSGTKTVERFDPKTNKWTMICSLREQLPSFTNPSITFRDKVTIFDKDRVEAYDATTNVWKSSVSPYGLVNTWAIFSCSHKVLTSEFNDN